MLAKRPKFPDDEVHTVSRMQDRLLKIDNFKVQSGNCTKFQQQANILNFRANAHSENDENTECDNDILGFKATKKQEREVSKLAAYINSNDNPECPIRQLCTTNTDARFNNYSKEQLIEYIKYLEKYKSKMTRMQSQSNIWQ